MKKLTYVLWLFVVLETGIWVGYEIALQVVGKAAIEYPSMYLPSQGTIEQHKPKSPLPKWEDENHFGVPDFNPPKHFTT